MSFWSKFAKTVSTGIDVAGASNIPPLVALDAAKDAIERLAKSDSETAAEAHGALVVAQVGLQKLELSNAEMIAQIAGLTQKIATMELQPKGRVDYLRLKTAAVAALAALGIYFGMPEDIATEAALTVTGIAATFIAGDSLRKTNPKE